MTSEPSVAVRSNKFNLFLFIYASLFAPIAFIAVYDNFQSRYPSFLVFASGISYALASFAAFYVSLGYSITRFRPLWKATLIFFSAVWIYEGILDDQYKDARALETIGTWILFFVFTLPAFYSIHKMGVAIQFEVPSSEKHTRLTVICSAVATIVCFFIAGGYISADVFLKKYSTPFIRALEPYKQIHPLVGGIQGLFNNKEEWVRLSYEAQDAALKEEYPRVLKLGERMLSIAKRHYGDADVDYFVRSYHWIGYAHWKMGQIEEARETFDKAINTAIRIGGANLIWLLGVSNSYAELYTEIRDFDKAEALLQKALVIHQAYPDFKDATLASSFMDLGYVYLEQGRETEAKKMFFKAIRMLRALPNAEPIWFAGSYAGLGQAYVQEGKTKKARRYLQRAMPIFLKALRPDHRRLGAVFAGLGYLNFQEEDYEEALEYFQRALALYRKNPPSLNSSIVILEINCGFALTAMGETEDAKAYYEDGIERARRYSIENVPTLRQALNDLGVIHLNEGNTEKAVSLLKEAAGKHAGHTSDELKLSVLILSNLATVLEQAGKYPEAIDYYQKSLNILPRLENSKELIKAAKKKIKQLRKKIPRN